MKEIRVRPGVLKDMYDLSTAKRAYLITEAGRKLRIKKNLSLASGILALISAGTIATALTMVLGKTNLQIIAGAFAAVSGTITLFIESYYKPEDTSKMFAGASEYLKLKNNIDELEYGADQSEEHIEKYTKQISAYYTYLDETYAPFIDIKKMEKLDRGNRYVGSPVNYQQQQ